MRTPQVYRARRSQKNRPPQRSLRLFSALSAVWVAAAKELFTAEVAENGRRVRREQFQIDPLRLALFLGLNLHQISGLAYVADVFPTIHGIPLSTELSYR